MGKRPSFCYRIGRSGDLSEPTIAAAAVEMAVHDTGS